MPYELGVVEINKGIEIFELPRICKMRQAIFKRSYWTRELGTYLTALQCLVKKKGGEK